MSEYSSSLAMVAIQRIVGALRDCGGGGFLYGGSLTGFRLGHDIDLLFVLSEQCHELVYQQVALIQQNSPLLLHPVVVTEAEMSTNPRLRELRNGALRLW
jgi:hypothetical protein